MSKKRVESVMFCRFTVNELFESNYSNCLTAIIQMSS